MPNLPAKSPAARPTFASLVSEFKSLAARSAGAFTGGYAQLASSVLNTIEDAEDRRAERAYARQSKRVRVAASSASPSVRSATLSKESA